MRYVHLMLLSALLAPAPASAIITYRDENGTLHAVQTEEEIPEQYRSKSKRLNDKQRIMTVGVAPMTKVGNFNLVDVLIGQTTYRFTVDKEEYTSQISEAIATKLNLQRVDKATVPTYQGPAKVPMVIVPAITVAGRKHDNFKVAVVPQDPAIGADGKLGKTFLERWDVKIDEANGRLLVEPKKVIKARLKTEEPTDEPAGETPPPAPEAPPASPKKGKKQSQKSP